MQLPDTSNSSFRILAIDDEPHIHQTYRTILDANQRHEEELDRLAELTDTAPDKKGTQFQLDSAYNGQEGLEMVHAAEEANDPYAVIYIDMRMPPGMDGLATAERVRQISTTTRIILITAYMDYDLEEIRNRIGTDFVFLSKPVKREELQQLTLLFAMQWQHATHLVEEHHFDLGECNNIPWEGDHSSEDGTALSPQPMRILLLDESAAIRTLYTNLLRRKTSYAVTTAADIDEAQSLAHDFKPDLTIIGFSLSEKGGAKLARQLLGQTPTGESLVVFLAQKSDVEEVAFMAGAIEVLFKEDPTEIFLQRISAMEHYISTQKQLRASIQLELQSYLVAAEEAKQASKAKDEFLATMSHELRTPLTVIIGNSEALSSSELTEDQQRLLRSVEISARGQLALINDILDLSKIEAGKFDIDETPFNLGALIDEIQYIFSTRAQDAGLSFTVTFEQRPEVQLLGDGRRIGQILINLLGNALKFTEQGGITLKVSIDDQLHLSVEDSGIGMSEDALTRLFQPYEQADASISRQYGGTGLGLHISCTLAALMEGKIDVESTEGRGSLFQLNLPYLPTELPASESTSNQRGALLCSHFSGKVLVAEDSPEIQMVVRRMLESMGIGVTLVNNGNEAVGAALNDPFDLILMDMQMPGMDGVEATKTLRNLGYTGPIVAMTANVLQQHRDQFKQACCNGFLAKPIDRTELLNILRQHLKEDTSFSPVPSEQNSAARTNVVDDSLMALFFERTNTLLSELKEIRSEGDWQAIRSISHTVKGSGSTFGHPQLTERGKVLCDLIDQGRYDLAAPALDELIVDMEQAVEP